VLVDQLDRLDRQYPDPSPERPARLHRRTPPAAEGKRHVAVTDAAENVLPEQHLAANPRARPLSDRTLQAGIDAQRHRLAYDQAAYSFGTCATFNREMKKVREFKIGGSRGVSGDYYAGKIYNDFLRYVSRRQAKAARAHWGSRYDSALDAARNQLEALGGEGYANYFAFAFKG
jgi:hypothetical protein